MNKEKKIITDFLRKMAEQDNRGTAFPTFYVIKDFKTEFINDEVGYNDNTPYHLDDDGKYWSFEEYNKFLKECGDATITEDEFEDLDNIVRGYFVERAFFAPNTLFLTETDAENHLKQNHYHYSPKAHTYVMHAWRAPELAEFLRALFSYFEVQNEKV